MLPTLQRLRGLVEEAKEKVTFRSDNTITEVIGTGIHVQCKFPSSGGKTGWSSATFSDIQAYEIYQALHRIFGDEERPEKADPDLEMKT